ncbi:hypothetical protein BDZ89DRAFT_404568 [Hymenopellis radicata]|nr:hypothetical protein BDZ89DRAFT_404568 [Hymenopellis radicata]
MNAVASPYTGTIQIGHTEWEDYLVDISRLTVLIPHDDSADLDEMTAVIDVLFQYMQIISSKGSMPLSELSFPHHSLPPLIFDESPSPVDTDLISLSPSLDDLEPSSPRFFTAPSSPSSEWNPSADPVWGAWNPAEDPVVDCGRRRTRNIAPGSGAAVYDSASVQDAKLYHPSPKRAITLDLLELEASDVGAPVLPVKESRISGLKASDWRNWIDWCRVQV